MGARVADSPLAAHLWGTDELRAVFDDDRRLQGWLDVLVAVAGAQAELGVIPAAAAAAIAADARVDRLDVAFVAAETRRTGHSTLGLIRGLQRVLPAVAREHVYYGLTVQDVTDTWTVLALRATGAVAWRDLRAIEARLLELALRYRDVPMPGRTHGQPGSPVTFGWKAASWADEVRRHLERLAQGAPRWLVGQFGGAVGTLGFFGDDGIALRRLVCARLGLADPGISWLTARDRLAEFGHLLAMVSATLARVGGEVYALQRPEIGELTEASGPATVASITMPHKHNPESAEHLDTLSRLVRANAAVLTEGMVGEHERDGRAWKAEWVAFPEVCLLTAAALAGGRALLDGLVVDTAAMAANLERTVGYAASERVLAALAPRVGKHRAQALLQEALAAGRVAGLPLPDALLRDEDLRGELATAGLDEAALRALVARGDTGAAGAMVDLVVARARAARAAEPGQWP